MGCNGPRRYRSPPMPKHWLELQVEFRKLVNQTGIDSELNTADHIIAKYLLDCLATFSDVLSKRGNIK